ncbi:MAG: O-antigen ligase family protein [Myxococcota bacterium]
MRDARTGWPYAGALMADASPGDSLQPSDVAKAPLALAVVLSVVPEVGQPGIAQVTAAVAILAVAFARPTLKALPERLLAALLGWAVLSTTWSVDAGQTVFLTALWLGGAAVVLAPRRVQGVVAPMLGMALAVASALALRQVLGGFQEVEQAWELVPRGREQYTRDWLARARAHGPFPSPDNLAGFLAAALPVVAGAAWNAAGPMRVAQGGAVLLGVAALVATRSVGGVLCLTVAACASAGLLLWRRGRVRQLAALGAVGLLVVGAVVWMRSGREHEPVLEQALNRARDWGHAFQLMSHAPLRGVGAGAYESAFNAWAPAGRPYSAYAHSAPLQLGVELGVVGLLLALALYVATSVWALRHAPRSTTDALLATGVLAACLHHFMDYELHTPAGLALFFAVAALRARDALPDAELPSAPGPWKAVACVVAAGVAVLGAGAAMVGRNIPRLPDDEPLLGTVRLGAQLLRFDARAQVALAQDLALVARREAQQGNSPARLISEYEETALRATELAPMLPAGPMLLARFRMERGEHLPAMTAYDIAIERSCCSTMLRRERMALARALGQTEKATQDEAWLKQHAPWVFEEP